MTLFHPTSRTTCRVVLVCEVCIIIIIIIIIIIVVIIVVLVGIGIIKLIPELGKTLVCLMYESLFVSTMRRRSQT